MNAPTPVPLSPLLPVSIEQGKSGPELVITTRYPHAPDRVWEVLVAPAALAEWSPFLATARLDAPGPTSLIMPGDGVSSDAELPCTVTTVEPPTALAYTWGDDMLAWHLAHAHPDTVLTLRHTMADAAVAPGLAAGWHLCLGVAATVLDGTVTGPIRGATAFAYGWLQLNEQYATALGLPPMDTPGASSSHG